MRWKYGVRAGHRRNGAPVAPLLAALVLVAALSACVAPRGYIAEPRPERSDTLMIGTFNIRLRYGDGRPNDWEERRETVIELIRMEDPDILALQEVMEDGHEHRRPSVQLQDLVAAFPDYEFVGAGDGVTVPSDNPIMIRSNRFRCDDDGTAFFSRTPEVPFSVAWAAGRPVYAQWALLTDLVTGERLYVVNVHYDHLSGPSKRNASRIVRRYLESELSGGEVSGGEIPVVVLGDFNSFRLSIPMSTLRRAGLRDGLPITRTGTYHMFTGVSLWPRIDHILVSDSVDVQHAYVCYFRSPEVFPSDHFPVFATVEID